MSLTLSLFCSTSFLLGIFPYKRNRRCSSGLKDWNPVSNLGDGRERKTHADIDFVLLMRIHGGELEG